MCEFSKECAIQMDATTETFPIVGTFCDCCWLCFQMRFVFPTQNSVSYAEIVISNSTSEKYLAEKLNLYKVSDFDKLTQTMSVVSCSPKCFEIYEAIRKSKEYRYIIFRLVSDAVVDVETVGPRDNDYNQFLEDLTRNGPIECRYGVFDLEYTHVCLVTKQEIKREKLVLLCWCPNEAKPKGKIQYLSYLRQFMDQLKGVQYYKTVREKLELSREAIEGFFRGKHPKH